MHPVIDVFARLLFAAISALDLVIISALGQYYTFQRWPAWSDVMDFSNLRAAAVIIVIQYCIALAVRADAALIWDVFCARTGLRGSFNGKPSFRDPPSCIIVWGAGAMMYQWMHIFHNAFAHHSIAYANNCHSRLEATPACMLYLGQTAAMFPVKCIVGWFIGDVISWIVHFSGDAFGPASIFDAHHNDPMEFTKRTFGSRCWEGGIITFPVRALLGTAGPGFTTMLGMSAGFVANEVHAFCHSPQIRPKWYLWLANKNIVLHPITHNRHHRPPYRINHSILVGWCHPIMNPLATIILNVKDFFVQPFRDTLLIKKFNSPLSPITSTPSQTAQPAQAQPTAAAGN